MRRPAIRFIIAALLATIVAVAVATLTLPAATSFGSEAINGATKDGFWENVIRTLALLPFAIPIGGMIALPTSLVMGGVMVWLIARWPQLDRWLVWIAAAVLASLPANLIVGGAYDVYPDRIILALWMAGSAIVGSLAFRWRWCERTERELP